MYRIATFIASFFLLASISLAQQATFQGLGDLEGGDFLSNALAVSADGSVVVGFSNVDEEGREAFRWEDDNMEGLGDLAGEPFYSEAYGVSADGSVVVGVSASENGDFEAFRWEGGEIEGLGDLPGGGFYSKAGAVSADGSRIVGGSESKNGLEAFYWEDGTMVGLGDLEGGDSFSEAGGVSANGTVVVGWGSSEDGFEAFRWNDGKMEGLGDLDGGDFYSVALDISADGFVIAGGSRADTAQAFRWEDGEMEGLGVLGSGAFSSQANAVSASGSEVVGANATDNGYEAFVWKVDDGMQNLKAVLEEDYNLDLTGWTLQVANDISDDGTVIVGEGLNPDGNIEAWRAFLGKPVADETPPQTLTEVLNAPSPNPVSGTSTFTIAVEQGQHIAVEVFDVMGRRVETVYEGMLPAGMSERLTLDASGLPAGVYVVRATGEDFTKTQRVTVVR